MALRRLVLVLTMAGAIAAISARAQLLSPEVSPASSPDSLVPILNEGALRDSIRASEHRLEQTRAQLDDLARRLEELGQREQKGLVRLAACEEKIRLTENYLRELADQSAARGVEVGRISVSIQRGTAEMDVRRAQLARRLVGIYKYSRVFPLQAALASRSLPDLYRRVIALRRIARDDRRILALMHDLSRRLEADRVRLLDARAELERLAELSRQQEASLRQTRQQETSLLQRVRSERDASQAIQRDLLRAALELESLVVRLQSRQAADTAAASGLAHQRGQLPWPLDGRVIAGFGARTHPRYQTRTANLGLDIKPRHASNATAVASGQVVYADRFLGYGNLVILDHSGGFYTLYGNLAELLVTVGSAVPAGSPVGTVSDYLHFELRRQGRPVDPQPWLAAR